MGDSNVPKVGAGTILLWRGVPSDRPKKQPPLGYPPPAPFEVACHIPPRQPWPRPNPIPSTLELATVHRMDHRPQAEASIAEASIIPALLRTSVVQARTCVRVPRGRLGTATFGSASRFESCFGTSAPKLAVHTAPKNASTSCVTESGKKEAPKAGEEKLCVLYFSRKVLQRALLLLISYC
jgi:hypothetical protein